MHYGTGKYIILDLQYLSVLASPFQNVALQVKTKVLTVSRAVVDLLLCGKTNQLSKKTNDKSLLVTIQQNLGKSSSRRIRSMSSSRHDVEKSKQQVLANHVP